MADKGKYVPIYLDWLDVTQDLTAEEKGNLIDAVVSYAAGKEFDSFLSGGAKIAFRFMKGQVDRNKEISEARSKAASKKEEPEAEDSKPEQPEANENITEQTTTNLPKEKDKEKEKEKENNKESVKRFTPPTVEEVAAFCKERNNGIDPEYFVAYYTRQNWVLSNGRKMSNWRMAVITWEKGNKKPAQGKTVVAQTYTQRDYSGEQDDALRRMLANADTA